MIKYFYAFLFLILSINSRGDDIPSHIFSMQREKCIINKNYKILSKSRIKKDESRLNMRLNSGTIRKFNLDCSGKLSNAFILNDKIRTHYQTLLIIINENKITGLKTLEFNEPVQYKAPKKWINSIPGKNSKQLFEVDALSGATLTRQSTLKLVKQALYYSSND